MIATKPKDLESISEDYDGYSKENAGDNGNGDGELKDISQVYFGNMAGYPILTREQEIGLAKEIRKGTCYRRERYGKKRIRYRFIMLERTEEAKAAAQKLILHNLPLVIFTAKHYMGFGLPFEDLVQEGNFALVKAANQYRYRKSRFSTYAIASIRKAIYRALKKLNRANRIGSLDETISDNGSSLEYIDSIPDSRALLPEENSELVKNENEECIRNLLVSQLDERSEGIIISRYWEGKILKKIGQEYGVSKERARQVQDRALKQLKESVEAAGYG